MCYRLTPYTNTSATAPQTVTTLWLARTSMTASLSAKVSLCMESSQNKGCRVHREGSIWKQMRMCAEKRELREGCHLTPLIGLSEKAQVRSPRKFAQSLADLISRLQPNSHNQGRLSLA